MYLAFTTMGVLEEVKCPCPQNSNTSSNTDIEQRVTMCQAKKDWMPLTKKRELKIYRQSLAKKEYYNCGKI